MSLRPWRIPLEKISVFMINPSIGISLLGIGRERTNLNSKRRDLNHPHTRIQRKVLNSINQAEACTIRTFHPKVEIGQKNRK
jgi:hypothetical protein